jgi:lipid II:glycine glycyltransferase (peptidoglycan interpeptide bridge formation enzyme)
MSDVPADYRDRLNLREQVARIDEMISRIERQQEETRKFASEQHKLSAEEQKLRSEQGKLDAEAMKLRRDRAFPPWTVVAALLGAGAALFAAGAGFVKLIGG